MVTMNNEDVYQNVAIHGFQQQSDASQPQIQNNAKSNDFFQECALKFLSFFWVWIILGMITYEKIW